MALAESHFAVDVALRAKLLAKLEQSRASSVRWLLGIGKLSEDRGELTCEGIEVLHRRNRQPDELIEVFDRQRTSRRTVGERRRLYLQLHEPL